MERGPRRGALAMLGIAALAGTVAACTGATVDGGVPGPGSGSAPEDCTNLVDDDGDAAADCQDVDCRGDLRCGGGGPADGATSEICDNQADDDGDGRIDCGDEACVTFTACAAGDRGDGGDGSGGGGGGDEPFGATEVFCDDWLDDDGDGAIDCDDTDCAASCDAAGADPWADDADPPPDDGGGGGGDAGGDDPWGDGGDAGGGGGADCGDNPAGACFCDAQCEACGDCCADCEADGGGGFGGCGCDTTLYCDWDGAWDCGCDPDCAI